jgi:predicted HAD superfamily Cof-like phosphohydrolase
MNPFIDQANFMFCAHHTTGVLNPKQLNLYLNLIDEEYQEVVEMSLPVAGGHNHGQLADLAKELTDLLVVTIGALHSIGINPGEAWAEVHRSNMSKCVGGRLIKRADGKVMKPDSYVPADLTPVIQRMVNNQSDIGG